MTKTKRILSYFLMLLTSFLLAVLIYIKYSFNNVTFEHLLFSLFTTKGVSFTALKEGLIYGTLIIIAFSMLTLIPVYISNKKKHPLNTLKYYTILLIIVIILDLFGFGVIDYFKRELFVKTTIYDDNYVNPQEVKITFPSKKKNLIYIYVESLEASVSSKEAGGVFDESLIPHLESIAKDNLNFSNRDTLGGGRPVDGTGWTLAGLIASSGGIPMKMPLKTKIFDDFIPNFYGAYTIGDILKANGYNNYFMLGSDVRFANRDAYFKNHGNYTIYDYNYLVKEGLIPEDYFTWWGYEDSKLFTFAKDKITAAYNEGTPFNFTILTADTHFPEGYIDESCQDNKFTSHYANSFACFDTLINDFITWIKEQPFYEDTVIVITGDHLAVKTDLYNNLPKNYDRTVYNAFINTDITTTNNKHREFTEFDIYPTTLAALGATINGERLALGTNLFSDRKTLVEELGYDYFNKELTKRDNYYIKNIMEKNN